MPARVCRTCGLVRVLGSPVVSAFSHLSNLSSLLKQCETSKCSEYLYSSFVPSLLVSDSMWMLCLSECSVLSSSPPFLCVKMWCYVAVCVGWETLKVSLKVSSEADVVNVWQVPIERLCLKCWRMHFLCFVTRREVWNKNWLWLGITHSLQWFVCLFCCPDVTFIEYANTLIYMYRNLGHGQPMVSPESKWDSRLEKLKI